MDAGLAGKVWGKLIPAAASFAPNREARHPENHHHSASNVTVGPEPQTPLAADACGLAAGPRLAKDRPPSPPHWGLPPKYAAPPERSVVLQWPAPYASKQPNRRCCHTRAVCAGPRFLSVPPRQSVQPPQVSTPSFRARSPRSRHGKRPKNMQLRRGCRQYAAMRPQVYLPAPAPHRPVLWWPFLASRCRTQWFPSVGYWYESRIGKPAVMQVLDATPTRADRFAVLRYRPA